MKKLLHVLIAIVLFFSALHTLVPAPLAFALEKDAFFYLLDGEFLGGYSKIAGNTGVISSLNNWSISPNLKVNDKLTWINLYNGSFNRSSQVVLQEEGGRQSEDTMSHSLSSALKYYVNDRWSLRPLFFVDWVFVNDTNDESFGHGLYDYRDIGGGIESAWDVSSTRDRRDEFRVGFRALQRIYPNYTALIALVESQAPEVHEKDFNGYKWTVSYDSNTSAKEWSWGVGAIFFYKDYIDKKTIDSNGILSPDQTRTDFLQVYNANISYPILEHWRIRFDGDFSYNASNLDFVDTHNTISLADDNFLKRYYNYFGFDAKPSLIYTQEIGKQKYMEFVASYAFYAQHYPGRKAQNVSGVYQKDDEQDYSHTFQSRISYPLTQYVSWVISGSYSMSTSNEKFEQYYLYNYDRWEVVSGFTLRY